MLYFIVDCFYCATEIKTFVYCQRCLGLRYNAVHFFVVKKKNFMIGVDLIVSGYICFP